MDAGRAVGKGPADEQGRVVLAVGGAGRDVEQQRLLVAGACPAQSNAVHQGGPIGKFLAELQPVVGLRISGDAHCPGRGRVGGVVREEPVVARGGHDLHLSRGQPVQVVLVAGIEVPPARCGIAHGVEAVAVFHVAAGSENAQATGVPSVGVVEAEVVAQLMGGHPACCVEGGADPRTGSADIAESGPVEAGNRANANEVEVELRQSDAGGAGGIAGVSSQDRRVRGTVHGRCLGHAQGGGHGAAGSEGPEGRLAEALFQVEGRDPVEHVGTGGIAQGCAGQITEIHPKDEQALEALGVSRFLAEDAIGIRSVAFVDRGQDESFVVVLGVGRAAQPGGVSAGVHRHFFGKGGDRFIGDSAQGVLCGRGHSGGLVGVENSDGIGVEREETVEGDAMQRDVGQRWAEQGRSVGVGPPSAITHRHRPVDRFEGAGVVRGRNAGQHTEIAPAVHGLFEEGGDGRRQLLAESLRDCQFQGAFRVSGDQLGHILTSQAGQLLAFSFQSLTRFG